MTKLRNRFVQVDITRDTAPMQLRGATPMSLLFIGADFDHEYFTTAKDAKDALKKVFTGGVAEEDEAELTPEQELVLEAVDVMFLQEKHHETLGVVGVESEGDLQSFLDGQDPFGVSYRIADVGTTAEGKDTLANWAAVETMFYYPTLKSAEELEEFNKKHGENNSVIAMVHDTNPLLGVGISSLASGNHFGKWWQKFKAVTGVETTGFKTDEINSIDRLNGNTYIRVEGKNVISNGKVISGEFADIIETEHYLIDAMRNKMWTILTRNDKIPYTQTGINMFVAGAREVLDLATDEDILARNAAGGATYTVSAPSREEIDLEFVKKRILPDLKFVAVPTGAIGSVRIEGVLTFDLSEVGN